MLVYVNWTKLDRGRRSPLWEDSLCLYGYLHPQRDWLLYLGKADFSTVSMRLLGSHKQKLFKDLDERYGINDVSVLHGCIVLESGRRTSQLLSDVESLLITRLKPYGNIQARHSRISRPGMRVNCLGNWPFSRWRFRDDG